MDIPCEGKHCTISLLSLRRGAGKRCRHNDGLHFWSMVTVVQPTDYPPCDWDAAASLALVLNSRGNSAWITFSITPVARSSLLSLYAAVASSFTLWFVTCGENRRKMGVYLNIHRCNILIYIHKHAFADTCKIDLTRTRLGKDKNRRHTTPSEDSCEPMALTLCGVIKSCTWNLIKSQQAGGTAAHIHNHTPSLVHTNRGSVFIKGFGLGIISMRLG